MILGGKARFHVPVDADVIQHFESMVVREPASGLSQNDEDMYREFARVLNHAYPPTCAADAWTLYLDIVHHLS